MVVLEASEEETLEPSAVGGPMAIAATTGRRTP
jgi:hypothetical protein